MIPFFHFGKPKNKLDWRCYVSRKLAQHLRVKWWMGISSSKKPKWFFGILLWEKVNND